MDQTWTTPLARSDTASPGPSQQWEGARLRQLAEVYLRAIAIGAPANELAETLANAVLGSELVTLAHAVLGNDQHRTARATELAAKILDTATSVVVATSTEDRHG